MKNATLSVRLVMLLGAALWVGSAATAAAQADDTPGTGDAAEPGDTGDGETDGGEPAEPGDAAAEGVAAEGVEAEGAEAEGEGADAAAEGTEGADEAAEDWVDDGHDEIAPPPALTDPAPPAAQTAPGPEEAASSELSEPEEEAPAEEEAAEEAPAPAGPEPLAWRNSFFSWTTQSTFNSFLRDAQLSYDPNVSMNFALTPRWYIAPTTFLWASQTLAIELTDSEGTALNRDPQLTDTLVDLRHLIPWEGFVFIAAGRLGFPTSKISQAAQRYLQTGLTLTVVRPISEAGLTLAGVFSYRRWWAGSNVVQVGEPQPDRCPPPPVQGASDSDSAPQVNMVTCDQLGTASAPRDVLLYGLNVVFTPPGFSQLNVSLSAFFFTTYGHELAPAYIEVDTRAEPLRIDDGSPSHWNNFTYFALSIGYQFLPWLNVSLGVQNSGFVASAYNPDGSVRNPIFTPDTSLFLTGTFQLDEIFNQIAGGNEEDLTPEERQRRRQGLASGPTTGGTF